MNSRPSAKTIKAASISVLGLSVGLALAACAPDASTSAAGAGAGAGVSSGSAAATFSSPAVTPSASAPAASGSDPVPAPGTAGGSGGSVTGSPVSNSSRVLLNCENQPQVKPVKYALGCDNAIDTLENLHWTKWGSTSVATGTEELNSCNPDCTGPSTYYPVTIEVDGDTAVLGNPHVYSEMTITYNGAVPTIDNGQRGGTVTGKTAHSWTVKLGYPRG